jgi:hypothetical protein
MSRVNIDPWGLGVKWSQVYDEAVEAVNACAGRVTSRVDATPVSCGRSAPSVVSKPWSVRSIVPQDQANDIGPPAAAQPARVGQLSNTPPNQRVVRPFGTGTTNVATYRAATR